MITLPVYGILTDDNSAIGAVVGAVCGALLLAGLLCSCLLVLRYHKRNRYMHISNILGIEYYVTEQW